MCNEDVEHKLHVFFDCPFATSCWHYVGVNYDMSRVKFAPEWLLQKLILLIMMKLLLLLKCFGRFSSFETRKCGKIN